MEYIDDFSVVGFNCSSQYEAVKSLSIDDAQLVAICHSLWNRLAHVHRTRRLLQTVKRIDRSES